MITKSHVTVIIEATATALTVKWTTSAVAVAVATLTVAVLIVILAKHCLAGAAVRVIRVWLPTDM